MSIFWITVTPKVWQRASIQNTGSANRHNWRVQQCKLKIRKIFYNNTNRIFHSYYTYKWKILADNPKLFITSYEISVFGYSEFSVQKINNHWSCWLGCLVVGSTVSKPDKGLDVRPLCLLCVAWVGVSGTSWSRVQGSHSGSAYVSNCVWYWIHSNLMQHRPELGSWTTQE